MRRRCCIAILSALLFAYGARAQVLGNVYHLVDDTGRWVSDGQFIDSAHCFGYQVDRETGLPWEKPTGPFEVSTTVFLGPIHFTAPMSPLSVGLLMPTAILGAMATLMAAAPSAAGKFLRPRKEAAPP